MIFPIKNGIKTRRLRSNVHIQNVCNLITIWIYVSRIFVHKIILHVKQKLFIPWHLQSFAYWSRITILKGIKTIVIIWNYHLVSIRVLLITMPSITIYSFKEWSVSICQQKDCHFSLTKTMKLFLQMIPIEFLVLVLRVMVKDRKE